MATLAHCVYCFECLAAKLDHKQPPTLQRTQELWTEYARENKIQEKFDNDDSEAEVDDEATLVDKEEIQSVAGSNNSLKDKTQSNSSSSSLSTAGSSTKDKSSSKSSSRSSVISQIWPPKPEAHPLFVTWNTISSRSKHKSLRGCIGTFAPYELSKGLRDYAITAAIEDHRFRPISKAELPKLQCCVTLLTNFSEPDTDPLNWTIGKHGLRISFIWQRQRLGATYLPDVAREQGWTKEQALISLMRKAGWGGAEEQWRSVSDLQIVRYEGKKVDLDYEVWREFSDWQSAKGVVRKTLQK